MGGRDIQAAAEFFEHSGDAASGDPLHIHLRDSQSESALAAGAAFESGGIEVHIAAHLGDGEREPAEASVESLGFETIGVALAGVGALVRFSVEGLGALDFHGLIEEESEGIGEAVGALVENDGDDLVEW